MSSPTPKLVNIEANAAIIQIRIANLSGEYEYTFKSKWPKYIYKVYAEHSWKTGPIQNKIFNAIGFQTAKA